jgi:membrane protein YqaA with SNARE-associated domain
MDRTSFVRSYHRQIRRAVKKTSAINRDFSTVEHDTHTHTHVTYRWYAVSFINALGASIGSLILIRILREYGEESLKESYPSIFESESWSICESFVERGGHVGAVLYSSLPIMLQPLVVIVALTGKMSDLMLVTCIFMGRCVKYLVMGYLIATSGDLIASKQKKET